MADRYAVATGNWSSTAVWSATSGGSSGASVPTASDDVYLNSNYTVTLTANATCKRIFHTNGTLALSSYRLDAVGAFASTGTTARTLNLGSGILEVGGSATLVYSSLFDLSGSNLTLTAGTSQVILNTRLDEVLSVPFAYQFNTLSKTFNDVRINLGTGTTSTALDITGSPTFRLLDIRSANTAAHTVNFEATDQTLDVEKLILIGASSSNKLSLVQQDIYNDTFIRFTSSNSTSYGQNISMVNVMAQTATSFNKAYIGTGSSIGNAGGNIDWIAQDPPKISTLVDPLTTAPASNTNWAVAPYSGAALPALTNSGHDGGGYRFSENNGIISTGTYDLTDTDIIVELPPTASNGFVMLFGWDDDGSVYSYDSIMGYGIMVQSGSVSWLASVYGSTYATNTLYAVSSGARYVKFKITPGSGDTSTSNFSISNDGHTWYAGTNTSTRNIPSDFLRSARIYAQNIGSTSSDLGSINPDLTAPPTLSTGSLSGTTIDSLTVTASGVTANPDSVTIDSYGVVYSTSPNPTITDSSQAGTGTSADFDNTLTGLSENTTYYIRSYAQWDTDNYAYGTEVSRKTQARPVVALNTPADAGTVTPIRPTLDFTGTDADINTITYQLQLHTADVWTAPQLDVLSASNAGFSNRSDSKTDPFYTGNQIRYTPQADLVKGQTYYWRVRGKDTNGSNTFGEWTTARSFTVAPDAPEVTLDVVYGVTFDTAEVDAEVTADGGGTVTERGVVYATTTSPTIADSKEIVAGTTGTFTASLSALAGVTTYYVRAYATNATGTSYSSETSFTTLQTPSAPTVITGTAANTTDTTSEYNGNEVTLDGTETVTERGIVFSDTETTPTTDDRKIVAPASGLGTFNLGITGLDPETTYYVRAYAVNSIGTGYGAVETFTTDAPFVPDEGDGYWTWTPSGSNAVIGRSQSTNSNSSVDLMLSDLSLENGASYTLYYSAKSNTNGETKMVLQWYDGATKTQQDITAGTPYTFTYDETKTLWAIRLFVTGASVEADNITATFEDMYLAKEATFSGFVPFTANGVTEVKIENNWLIDKQRSDVITTMFDAIKGDSWYPFNIDTEGLGWFEIGDRFTIQDDDSNDYSVVLWNSKLTVDGGIRENLFTKTPDLTETNYNKAGKLNGLWKRTQIEVDKNAMEIESLVEAIYDYDGVINTQFSQVEQDLDGVRTTVQGSGGVNLIQNSVMYAFDTDNLPDSWEVTDTNLISNYDFESDTSDWVTNGGSSINSVTTQSYTGSKSLSISAPGGASHNGIAVSGGTEYTISAWVYASAGVNVELAVDHYDADVYVNGTYGTSINGNGSWQNISQTFTTDAAANLINMTFKTTSTTTFYLDNVYVAEGDTAGPGTLIIQASPESLSAGAVAGNAFTLQEKTATQTITVRKDVDFIEEEDKTYYSLSAKVKKNTVGVAHIKLTNRNETLTIDLPDQTSYYWETVKLEEILPLDDYYEIEIYSDDDADLQVTDLIFAPGKTKREWTQANGEVMNSSVSITENGMTIRSPQFANNYTKIDALGFEVHSKEVGGDRVFGFNDDETNVSKLKADKQMSMTPIRIVPVDYSTYKGWAFTPSKEDV